MGANFGNAKRGLFTVADFVYDAENDRYTCPNSRLNVCLAATTRNSSKIHWQRSTIRQRTTPCTAGIGPLSSIAASATRCAPFRHDGCPGGLRSISPSSPHALNFITQSRTECQPADLSRLRPARLRKSLPAPEAAWPEAHPSTALRRPSPSAHQNQSEVELAWRTSRARHLESDTRRFGNLPIQVTLTELRH